MADYRKPRRWRKWIIFGLLALVMFLASRTFFGGPSVPEGAYLLLDLQGEYAEHAPDEVLYRLFAEPPVSLLDLLLLIRNAREDGRVKGMVVRLRPLQIGWAKAQDIRTALQAFRDAGKPLYAYLEQEFSASTLEYYVASVADRVYLPPGAAAPVNGLLAQYVFLGGVWEKLDIDMEVEKIREYKTFGDMITNKEMSPYHREMANSLLDSIYGQFIDGIAEARRMKPAAVRGVVDTSPATAAELEARGLADGARFLDELRVELAGRDGEFFSAEEYRQADGPPLASEPSGEIAVIYGAGTVMTGESQGSISGSGTMGADTVSTAFREASERDEVKSILFRIDSPGGSALASDLIWRAVDQARAVKPVIVSMSDVAGSGGYYVAAAASKIVAQPATMTGSIGVVLSKPNISGLLANLGINTESLRRGDLAELTSLTKSLTPAERRRLTDSMNHVYQLFVERVSTGRGISPAEVEAVGRGRVWTGEQAKDNGLVDELGGFFAAIDAAKESAGISRDERMKLVFYPKRKPFLARLADLLSFRMVGGPPPFWNRLRASLLAYEFRPGSVLALMPQQIEIR
jgi:protease-4